jgi:putative salt-induced outer membrane protein
LTGFKSQLIKFNASLNVAMTTTMALTVGVIDTYNSKVGAGMKKNDVSLFTGVSVKFGG